MVDLMAGVAASGRVSVMTDAIKAVLDSELSPYLRRHALGAESAARTSRRLSSSRTISRAMRGKTGRHVFVFRSTLVPGTVEDVLRPIIEQESGKKDGRDFDVCFQPEFLREGTSIRDYDRPPFTVVGANARCPWPGCASCRSSSVRVPWDIDPGRGNGQGIAATTSRPQDYVRQRNRAPVRGLGRRRLPGHGSGVQRPAAQYLIRLPQARVRVRGSCLPKDLRATLYSRKHAT